MKLIITLSTICLTLINFGATNTVPRFGFPEDDDSIDRGRIINGHDAKPGEAPYIVSLKSSPGGSHFCGGSILSSKLVLTAAHCLGGSIWVVAGLHDRNNADGTQTIRVMRQIKHEGFGGGVGPNDIALLELEKPLQLNSRVQAIALPKTTTQPNGQGTLFGWGKTLPNSGLPNTLQTVVTDLVPYPTCKKQLPSGAPIQANNICSASRNSHISACNGDSGGPLVAKQNNVLVQVGIVSWGVNPCGQANYPSVYTYTGAYLAWIKTNSRN